MYKDKKYTIIEHSKKIPAEDYSKEMIHKTLNHL